MTRVPRWRGSRIQRPNVAVKWRSRATADQAISINTVGREDLIDRRGKRMVAVVAETSATARRLHRLARCAAKPISTMQASAIAFSSVAAFPGFGYGARSTSVFG